MFQRAADDLFQESSRSMRDFINGQLYGLAIQAIKQTEKANRQQIEKEMGVVKRKETLRGGKAGKKGWVRITKRILGKRPEDTFAGRILLKRHRDTGSWGIRGDTLAEKAINLIAAKVRSVAFIKSGWIPAVQTLATKVYRRQSIFGAKKMGRPKGYAIPAPFTLSGIVKGEIANTALIDQGSKSTWHGKRGDPRPVAEKGLSIAMRLQANDMATELARRLKVEFSKVSVK